MNALRGIARFCYDFVVGDDWKVAAAVVVSLCLTTVVYLATDLSDEVVAVVGAVFLVALFTVSMVVDVRGAAQSTGTSE